MMALGVGYATGGDSETHAAVLAREKRERKRL
jgi:hypothetical protein